MWWAGSTCPGPNAQAQAASNGHKALVASLWWRLCQIRLVVGGEFHVCVCNDDSAFVKSLHQTWRASCIGRVCNSMSSHWGVPCWFVPQRGSVEVWFVSLSLPEHTTLKHFHKALKELQGIWEVGPVCGAVSAAVNSVGWGVNTVKAVGADWYPAWASRGELTVVRVTQAQPARRKILTSQQTQHTPVRA